MADFNLSVFLGSSETETTGSVLTEVLENALDALDGRQSARGDRRYSFIPRDPCACQRYAPMSGRLPD